LRITILGKSRCVLLHFDSSKRCVFPLYKFLYAFKVVKLFLKHPVHHMCVKCRVCICSGSGMYRNSCSLQVSNASFLELCGHVHKNNYTLSRVLPLIFTAMRASDRNCIIEFCLTFEMWNYIPFVLCDGQGLSCLT
jgi:hypothetical protein